MPLDMWTALLLITTVITFGGVIGHAVTLRHERKMKQLKHKQNLDEQYHQEDN